MKIKVLGLPKVQKEIRSLKTTMRKQKKRVLNQIVTDLRAATPVDTGEARDGWYATRNSIENDVDHIDALNAGSSQQAPSHFVERTILRRHGVFPNGIIVTTKK